MTRAPIRSFIAVLVLAGMSRAQRFFPDDPLQKELPPVDTRDANYRAMSDLWEGLTNLFGKAGERHPDNGVIPSMGVNTLGEPLEGVFYVPRHAKKRMTAEELTRGPAKGGPPAQDKPWQVLRVKRYDVRPGLLIADSGNQLYLIRLDPSDRPEMSTGATMVGANVYHALGYWAPENYIVEFRRSDLVASPEGKDINAVGKANKLLEEDIDLLLAQARVNKTGRYRVVATKAPTTEVLGPMSFIGTRHDDPNDLFPHEHRRELRALSVFAAWLGQNWISPSTTLDFLVEESGVKHVRHFFVDFFASLGSGWQRAKEAREGNELLFDWDRGLKNFLGFGIYSPEWQRARFPNIRGVGRFEHETFDPRLWMPNTHLAPLANALPDDKYWAAKQVMAFTDDDICALVKAGKYSDPRAVEWLSECLIRRRDKIGKAFFADVLPLDDFRIEDGRLKFKHLGAHYGFVPEPAYTAQWTTFNNFTGERTPITGANDLRVPLQVADADIGTYFAVLLSGGDYGKSVDVFVRKEASGLRIVGIERNWPGKRIAQHSERGRKVRSPYPDLERIRKELFDGFTRQYNQRTGFALTPADYFESLSISERTVFDGVTHALMMTQLTDEAGASLGSALDLVTGIERISGHQYGRQGDEQFRVYVRLREGARQTLEKSRQFSRTKDNAVYHIGYPVNFRQAGKMPTLQISMTEDGTKADIDVDYLSSKMPEALWNGHLSSANSDIRAGKNYARHTKRWAGLVNWWRRVFGDLSEEEAPEGEVLAGLHPAEVIAPLPPNRPMGADIPELSDAAQEFLTDWLVRHEYDEAMEFISDESLTCLVISPESTLKKGTRKGMRELLQASGERFGEHSSLSTLITAARAWGPNIRRLDHRYSREFDLVEVTDSLGESSLCRNRKERVKGGQPTEPARGTYYATLFRFRIRAADEGALALLWKKESGQWRILSYDAVAR
jgi:hypothetical protein